MIRQLGLCFLFLSVSGIATAADEGFVPLFNGKDLTGWEGNLDLWKVDNGMIVGDSPGIAHNQFLATTKQYEDFELRLEFRLVDGKGNSGVQFRSLRVPESTEVSGYQADLGEGWWGSLYDESRRKRMLATATKESLSKLNREGWNEYTIRAEGDHVTLAINGVTTVDYHEEEADIRRKGIIALQVHSGPPLRVEFRNIRIKSLEK